MLRSIRIVCRDYSALFVTPPLKNIDKSRQTQAAGGNIAECEMPAATLVIHGQA